TLNTDSLKTRLLYFRPTTKAANKPSSRQIISTTLIDTLRHKGIMERWNDGIVEFPRRSIEPDGNDF
ncbi:MAG: hypothetical protein V2A69_02895, partial [Pseudomonadota bacterium]